MRGAYFLLFTLSSHISRTSPTSYTRNSSKYYY